MFKLIRKYYFNLIPHLTEQEWYALQERMRIRTLSKGQFAVREGEICRDVFFINSGFLRLYQVRDGKEVCTGFVGADDYVSIYDSFLTGMPALENLEVMEDAQLICLSYDDMQQMYKLYPVYQVFGRKIAEQLFIGLTERINALLLLTPEQRYASMIENGSDLLQRVPQYMLASYIGVTPEHLSRIRKSMTRRI